MEIGLTNINHLSLHAPLGSYLGFSSQVLRPFKSFYSLDKVVLFSTSLLLNVEIFLPIFEAKIRQFMDSMSS